MTGLISSLTCIILLSMSIINISHSSKYTDTLAQYHLSKHWSKHSQIVQLPFDIPLWGSFRPDIYFGLRTRSNPGIVTGITWSNGNKWRHSTNQAELKNFQWNRHNGRDYGEQTLIDNDQRLNINTSFVLPNKIDGKMTSTWIQRVIVSGQLKSNELPKNSKLVLYMGVDCSDRRPSIQEDQVKSSGLKFYDIIKSNSSNTFSIIGYSNVSQWFVLFVYISIDSSNDNTCLFDEQCNNLDNHFSFSGLGGNKDIWSHLTTVQRNELSNQLSNNSSYLGIHIKSNLSFVLEAQLYEHIGDSNDDISTVRSNIQLLIPQQSDFYFNKARDDFDKRFELTFQSIVNSFSSTHIDYAKVSLSSLLGGIGYFYGKPIVGDSADPELSTNLTNSQTDVSNIEPIELLSATPSRTVFPRGFLWDEGFHQLLVSRWDAKLSLTIISHWLNAIYVYDGPGDRHVGGWIPREMILGDIGRGRVPDEFVTQRVDIANPPSIFLAIDSIIDQLLSNQFTESDSRIITDSLRALYSKLNDWLVWLRHSQAGSPNYSGSYRWRGRSNSDNKIIPNTLASGLDDYPRSPFASPLEHHVDLHAWIARCSLVMSKLQNLLEITSDIQYDSEYSLIVSRMNDLHWFNDLSRYADVGLYNNANRYELVVKFRCKSLSDPPSMVDVQVPLLILNKDTKKEDVAVYCPPSYEPLYPHMDSNGKVQVYDLFIANPDNQTIGSIPSIGYVNIFPFILQLIDRSDEQKLGSALDMIGDPELLWSGHGIRSLAKSDLFYSKRNAPGDAPYWRGYIWININYLVLSALRHYSSTIGPYQNRMIELHRSLRSDLLTSVLGSMERTGELWEQFDDSTGYGMRGYPFTGWTSLITLIMNESI